MNYCVYEWYDSLYGDVFYVGCGTEERARHAGAGRNKAFKKKVEEIWPDARSRILFRNLSKEEALAKEKEVLSKYADQGVKLLNVVNYVEQKRRYDDEHIVCPCCGEIFRGMKTKDGWVFEKQPSITDTINGSMNKKRQGLLRRPNNERDCII